VLHGRLTITCIGGSHEGSSRPVARAGDLRDAAIWTSEAVCYTTISSVDAARFSRGSPEEILTLVTQKRRLEQLAGQAFNCAATPAISPMPQCSTIRPS
jgi:hypothetical protein